MEMTIKNESGDVINYMEVENNEWQLAEKFVKPHHKVLELGARYGSTSIVINKILMEKQKQVSVEPDFNVWDSLEKNRQENNCEFIILKGSISKQKESIIQQGYSTFTFYDEKGHIDIFDLWEIQKNFDVSFNALIADCEGCLSKFIDDYPEFFQQLELVIFEQDCSNICNYGKLKELMIKNGLKQVVGGFHNVYTK